MHIMLARRVFSDIHRISRKVFYFFEEDSMKKRFGVLIPVLAAFVAVLVGCISAQSYLDRGDPVSAIEKLSSILAKKPGDQEAADMFVSVYPSEVENRLHYTERTVDDVVNDFVRNQGSSSLSAALQKKKASLGSGRFLSDDSEIRSVLRESEDIYRNLKDLNRIQKAVVKVPAEIGDYSTGEVYYVEKYTDNFAGMYSDAGKSIAEFYYAMADASAPGNSREEKKQIYELYGKVGEYTTGLSGVSNKRAQAAYNVAEDYLSGSTVAEKKEAITWYNKARQAVSNYNDTSRRIQEANYQIARLYMDGVDENNNSYQTKNDLRSAITYFEDAGNYRDAPEWLARAREILYRLENPEPVVDETSTYTDYGTSSGSSGINVPTVTVSPAHETITCLSPVVMTYENDRVYAHLGFVINEQIPLRMKNLVPSLNSGRATAVSISSGSQKPGVMNEIKSKARERIPAGNFYIITLEVTRGGTYSYSYTDNDGWAYTMIVDGRTSSVSPTYTISDSEISRISTPAGVVIYDEHVSFPAKSGEVSIGITVNDLMTDRQLSHIKVSRNTTGGSIARIEKRTRGSNYTTYNVILSGVKNDGEISFFVLNDSGEYMPVRHNSSTRMGYVEKPTAADLPVYRFFKADIQSKDYIVYGSGVEYPSSEKTARIPFTYKSSTGTTLGASNIKVRTNTAGVTVSSVTMNKDRSGNCYINLSNVTKSGKFEFNVVDFNGYTVTQDTFTSTEGANSEKSASPIYSIDVSKVYTPAPAVTVPEVKKTPAISYGGMSYGSSCAFLNFTITNYDGTINSSNIKVATNTTGGSLGDVAEEAVKSLAATTDLKSATAVTKEKKVAAIDKKATAAKELKATTKDAKLPAKDTGLTKEMPVLADKNASRSFTVKLQNVKQDGKISFYVVDKSGSYIAPSGTTGKFTPKEYSVSKSSFYNLSAGTVVYGTTTYPGSESVIYIPVTISGGVSPANVTVSSQSVKSGSNPTVTISAADAAKGKYNLVIKGADIEKTGNVALKLTDGNGLVIATSDYVGSGANFVPPSVSVNRSNMYIPVKAIVTPGSVVYSSSDNRVYLEFSVAESSERLAYKSIKILTNTTGGTYSVLNGPSSGKYQVEITGVQQDGVVTFDVYDNSGKTMPWRVGGRTTNTPEKYIVSKSKVYSAPTISYGNLVYPKNASEVRIPFTVYDTSKLLDRNAPKVNTSVGGQWSLVCTDSNPKFGAGSAVHYELVFTGITSSTGKISFNVVDPANQSVVMKTADGKAVPTYTVQKNQIYEAPKPSMEYSYIDYGTKVGGEVKFYFNVRVLTKERTLSHIKVLKNTCGGTLASITKAESDADWVQYYLTLKGIKSDGVFSFAVLDDSKAAIPVSSVSSEYAVSLAGVHSPYTITYGTAPTYPSSEKTVNIPFTVAYSGTAPTFTKNSIVVERNGTKGTVSNVVSAGNGKWNIVLSGVTSSGNFSYRVKDASGYTLVPASKITSSVVGNYKNIDPGSVDVDASKLYVAPYVVFDPSVTYSTTTDGMASVKFTLYNAGNVNLGTGNIEFITNTCGSTSQALVNEGKSGTGVTYRLDIMKITKSGNFAIAVKDSSGKRYKADVSSVVKSVSKDVAKDVAKVKDSASKIAAPAGPVAGIPATQASDVSPTWSIDYSKVLHAPTVKALPVEYPKEDGKVIVPFEVTGATFTLAKENLNLSLGTTGATAWTLEKVTSGTPAVGKTIRYNIVLTGVKSSGVVAFVVMDPTKNRAINASSGQITAQVIYESVFKTVKALLGANMEYVTSNNKPCVKLLIGCTEKNLTAANVTLVTNNCGAAVESLGPAKDTLGKSLDGMYSLIVSVKTSGKFSFSLTTLKGAKIEIVANASSTTAKSKEKVTTSSYVSPEFTVKEAEIKKVTPAQKNTTLQTDLSDKSKLIDSSLKDGIQQKELTLPKEKELTLPKVEEPKVTNPKVTNPKVTNPRR